MTVRFFPVPTDLARAWRDGAPDAYGAAPERVASSGGLAPCRHCLRHVAAGAPMLILAHRPFPRPQPYAETGPIFLCGDNCGAWDREGVPPIFATSPAYLLRGYGPDDRIVYGTGAVTPAAALADRAAGILDDPRVAYAHVRSASNNCFQARVERRDA